MNRISMALMGLFLSLTPAMALDLDKQIEETNVIVGGVCSGTIISKEQRLVLTAYHCVNDLFQEVTEKQVNPNTGEVREITKQKLVPLEITVNKVRDFTIVSTEQHSAKVVGSDSTNDIALIKVDDVDWHPLSEVKLAPDSFQYHRGTHIYAVGNPGIQFDNSVTEGIISSPARTIHIDDKDLKVFQHSASIIGGNSGGSIINEQGELIGTVSAGLRGANISFAVPISYTKEMLKNAGIVLN